MLLCLGNVWITQAQKRQLTQGMLCLHITDNKIKTKLKHFNCILSQRHSFSPKPSITVFFFPYVLHFHVTLHIFEKFAAPIFLQNIEFKKRKAWSGCTKTLFFSFTTATLVTIDTLTPQSVWDSQTLQIKPMSSVWMERRMSFWQKGNCLHKAKRNTTFMHTCKSHSIPFCLCRYRKVPSDRCEGGFSPQLIKQTVKACGIKPSPAPPAMSTSSVTHFDTPVSRLIVLFQSLLHFIKLSLFG